MPRKRKAEAATDGGAASPAPETPQSLNQQRKAGIPRRDRRERFNQ